MDDETMCDQCAVTIPMEEAHTCEHCGGTYCEAHTGRLDHDCTKDEHR